MIYEKFIYNHCVSYFNYNSNFLKDMGFKPFPRAQIDRIDNDKGYCKFNCRWITARINSHRRPSNKLSLLKAREIRKGSLTQPVKSLAELYKVHVSSIYLVLQNKTWKEEDIYVKD